MSFATDHVRTTQAAISICVILLLFGSTVCDLAMSDLKFMPTSTAVQSASHLAQASDHCPTQRCGQVERVRAGLSLSFGCLRLCTMECLSNCAHGLSCGVALEQSVCMLLKSGCRFRI